MQKNKILRNVVTAIRRVPQPGAAAGAAVQASEDLQLRLWDTRQGILKGPAAAVRAGPNQLICLDVSPDGNYVACGSKGFSRENCEVKVFDLRASLQELHALPCADQTIEALRHLGSDRCLTASKDGHVRAVSLPSPKVVLERRSTKIGAAGYTALGVSETGAALCAWVGPEGVGLELLAWKDLRLDQQPTVLATT
ncbi:unnamed protein product [Symbiodinium sp. KB8]|nr:unnamed protein product [Symbiodinium sp. KB8]